MRSSAKNIGIFGLWHLGCVYAASLAKAGFEVTGFDFDVKVINNLKWNSPPIYEPDLEKILKKHNNKNLHFTSSQKQFFQKKDYLFITHDVPVDSKDIVQMEIIDKTFKLLVKYISSVTTIVICSQIPIGSSRKLIRLLETNGIDSKVIYFPENLRLGQAFNSFLTPDRIVLGSDSMEAMEQFKKDFTFLKCPFITMSLESAEMVKHALNAYLATCISFSSELSDLSEKSRSNMSDVVKALKTDKRVSPFAPINPGLGFAGGTLGRDIQTLKKLARDIKYEPKLLNSVYAVNQDRIPKLVSKIKSIHTSLKGKSIGILGLTYRPNTDTLRRSMSVDLIAKLKSQGCKIKAFDPVIKNQIKEYPSVKVCNSIETFFENLNMVILMTEWSEFLNINPKLPAELVNEKIIIDTKNFLDKEKYENSGFTVLRMGEGQ